MKVERQKNQPGKEKIMSDKTITMETKKKVLRKMIRCRSRILEQYPFYGYLVMHLQLGVADCGTACTNMKHILFDPDFAERLSDDEMVFVMLHEVLHCALAHCTRARNYRPMLFNIAADIVVNSNILYSMGIAEFEVDGAPVMHTTPDGQEGYHFSAEEVYKMLLQSDGSMLDSEKGTLDSHAIWSSVEDNSAEGDKWRTLIAEGGKKYSSSEIPQSVREYNQELERESKVDWRTVLQDFIQIYHDNFDYSFSPADRRYTWSDFVMPAYSEQDNEWIENLWFCVDTSGSICRDTLSAVMSEIRQAILLFDHLSGKLSFFDTKVTKPISFENEEDLYNTPAAGGGGTSFTAIFQCIERFFGKKLPTAIIVLTDGYCDYPEEEAAMDIPVLWVICDNPADPPWGRVVHMDSV